MPRTTLDFDATVLRELRRRQAVEGKTIGARVSELLAAALAEPPPPAPAFSWVARPMAARVDLEDKDAVHAALDAR